VEDRWEECAGDQDKTCELGADGHSVSVNNVENFVSRIRLHVSVRDVKHDE
jgi:hypothetical protein